MNMLLRLAGAVVALLAFAPTEARAAWVGTFGDHLYYNAAGGELNTVRVTLQPNGDIRFTDAGANAMIAESGCSRPGTSVADCSSAGVTHIKVRLEDRDDLAIIDVGLRALVWGHDGDDTLVGGAGNDELYGGWGADELSGRAGRDVIDGGANLGDTALYSDHSTPVLIELFDGKDETAGSPGENDRLYGIRNLSGGGGDDALFGDGRRNRIWGGGGNDTLGGGPLADFLDGGPGNDRFIEGWLQGGGPDDMIGGIDTDVVDYSAGNWPIYFGEGVYFCTGSCPPDPDPYAEPPTSGPSTYGPIVVTLDDVANDGRSKPDNAGLTTEGDNVHSDIENVTGSPGVDELIGSALANALVGNGGPDRLVGGDGNDDLFGGDGADVILGGVGDDSLAGNLGGDVLLGEDGRDTVTYAGRSTRVFVTIRAGADDGEAGEGDDVHVEHVVGTAYDDILVGSDGSDTLEGLAGPDQIAGGDGADVLSGGSGSDQLNAKDDWVDSVDCGADPDVASIDALDRPVVDCETRNDPYPPRVICQNVPQQWTRGPVTVACTAADDDSPPATPASFTLTASLPFGQESDSVRTNIVTVCDSATPTNCIESFGTFWIDRKGPAIFAGVPAQGQRFILNETVAPFVTCADGGVDRGRPVKRCGEDTLPRTLDTSAITAGRTVQAIAEDTLDNHSFLNLTYAVGYALCNESSTVGITEIEVFVSLCDANGDNVSDPQVALENLLIDGAKPEAKNDGFQFTKDVGYVLRIPSDGLSSGTHALTFTAGLDPLVHRLQFDVP